MHISSLHITSQKENGALKYIYFSLSMGHKSDNTASPQNKSPKPALQKAKQR